MKNKIKLLTGVDKDGKVYELVDINHTSNFNDYLVVRRVKKFLFFKRYEEIKKYGHSGFLNTRNIQIENAKKFMLTFCDYLK
jgi:hypothetical protein